MVFFTNEIFLTVVLIHLVCWWYSAYSFAQDQSMAGVSPGNDTGQINTKLVCDLLFCPKFTDGIF